MASKDYAEKLKDPRWQRKRLQIFERDGWKCTECGAVEKQLHVHHKRYIAGRNPWEYADHYLATVCHECHKNEHAPDATVKPMALMNIPTLRDYLPGGKFEHLLNDEEKLQAQERHSTELALAASRNAMLARAKELGLY